MSRSSALTGASTDAIYDNPLVRKFCLDAMGESALVGDRTGCRITQSAVDWLALAWQCVARSAIEYRMQFVI